MRVPVLALLLTSVSTVSTAAGTWKEYDYPEFKFAVSFPADPIVDSIPYKAADGTVASERTYSVKLGMDVFQVAVIDLSNAPIDETTAMGQAIAVLRDKGDVRVDIPARVNRHRGRQLSIVENDGSHLTAAVFFADHRLYEIEGIVLAGSDDPNSGDAIRFQQSLRFTGDNAPGFRRGFPNRQFPPRQRFQRGQRPRAQPAPAADPPSL